MFAKDKLQMAAPMSLLLAILLAAGVGISLAENTLESAADMLRRSQEVAKRPFCNGFTGCGNLRKRPFCNGFTGCSGHGKRTATSAEGQKSVEQQLQAAREVKKRPFCNGFTGCGNMKRLEQERQARTGGGVSKRPFCNGLTGCSGRGPVKKFGHDAQQLALSLEEEQLWRRLIQRLRQLQLHQGGFSKKNTLEKRPFCNGFTGCNGRRR